MKDFEALLDMIVSQQVSVAAGNAIWKRIANAGLNKQSNAIQASDDEFRECGLSRQKISYARALAASDIDYGELRKMPDAEIVAMLTGVKGIGRWTAEIYAMFALGKARRFRRRRFGSAGINSAAVRHGSKAEGN